MSIAYGSSPEHLTADMSTAFQSYNGSLYASTPEALVVDACEYVKRGNYPVAIHACKLALERNSACMAAYIELAAIYHEQWDLEAMEAVIARGLAVDPECAMLRADRAQILLLRGEREAGLADYEYRPSRQALLKLLDEWPEWDGLPLNGKRLLVVKEGGFGDQIMYARWIPHLRRNLTEHAPAVMCSHELGRLFEDINCRTSNVEIEHERFDCWIGMPSLAMVPFFRNSSIPPTPYLNLADVSRFTAMIPQTGRLRVGLCWSGGPKPRHRSTTYSKLAPILDMLGCDFYSLQAGKARAEQDSRVTDLMDDCADFADTAALIQNLDLVITIDTSVAHLAGAMGKQVWMLLTTPYDWRWGMESATTPWYESMTIVRGGQSMERAIEYAADKLKACAKSHAEQVSGDKATGSNDSQSNESIDKRNQHSYIVTRPCRYGEMSWDSRDQWVGRSLDILGEYSQGEVDLFRAVLKTEDVVVEVGANIGAHTVPLAQIVGIDGCVWAFEPARSTFKILHENVIRNCAGVKLAPMVLGRHQRTDIIIGQPNPQSPGCFEPLVPMALGEEGLPANETTVDSYRMARLDFLKADVERMELDVLIGAEQTIARCRPLLYCEADKPDKVDALIEWILAHGYRIYQHKIPMYSPDNFRGYKVNVFGGATSIMIFCVPQERYDLRHVTDQLERVRALA